MYESVSLRQALTKICDVKEIEIIAGKKQITYCYSYSKVEQFLQKKLTQLTKFLSDKHEASKSMLV